MIDFLNSLKYKTLKRYIVIVTIFFFNCNISYSQELYIMNYAGPKSAEDCQCTWFFLKVESYGIVINPIFQKNDIFIYDKKPTYFESQGMRPDSELCSGYCHDGFSLSVAEYFTGNCNGAMMTSNQVLIAPNALDNTFCDKISLVATGCTGTQRFFWEYSTDNQNFNKINVNTGVNQTYEFIKSNFPLLNNYIGNIFFRVLIDSDPSIIGDNIYSNVANYNINSCSPLLNGNPIAAEVRCNNESNGSVTLNFKTDITSNQKLLLNLFKDNNFMTHKFVSPTEIVNKSFTWSGIAAGSYVIKYQAQTNTDNNTLVGSQPVISPPFTIANVTPLTFTITPIQPACVDDKGKIQISASGGTAPYFYVLDNESLTNKHSFTGLYIIPDELPEGDHTVIVVDSRDCIEK